MPVVGEARKVGVGGLFVAEQWPIPGGKAGVAPSRHGPTHARCGAVQGSVAHMVALRQHDGVRGAVLKGLNDAAGLLLPSGKIMALAA